MKSFLLTFSLSAFAIINLLAQESCLQTENLKALDRTWEEAILNSDIEYLESFLAEDYVWVHNHASMTETKTSLIERIKTSTPNPERKTISRNSNGVEILNLGKTAVVTGFTIVERANASANYNFMRTYAAVGGECFLLANHTMQIPAEED